MSIRAIGRVTGVGSDQGGSADERAGSAFHPGAAFSAGQLGIRAPGQWITSSPWGVAGAILLIAGFAAGRAAGTVLVSRLTAGEVFFPAAGVTVAALLLLPRGMWGVILAAAFCCELGADLVMGETVTRAVGSAVASTVGPAVGAVVLLAWVGGPPLLSRRRQLLAFIGGPAAIGTGLGALIGAAVTVFLGPHGDFFAVLARWWTGDALGVLIVGGLLVAWLTETSWLVRPRYRRVEVSALAASAALLAWLAFWSWRPGLTYLSLLPLGWAAIRFGARGATAVAMLMAVVGEWGTVTGHGLFAAVSHTSLQALWLLQLFLAVAIVGGLVLANQVAELGRAEAALRDSVHAEREARLAAREAGAAERSRLARELHDSVSQALFSMTMHARTAQLALERSTHPADGPLARAVGQFRELTAGALAEMRALIFELRPGALAEEGLVAALGRQAAAISAREQLPVTVEGPRESLPLTAAAEEDCYRVALEAMHNAVKHAAASHIQVVVTLDRPSVRISVTDDGTGFDAGAERPGHIGLRSMAERAKCVGGHLELITAPDAGTCVQLTVPIQPAAELRGAST